MCEHRYFEILYYENHIMVRKCCSCGSVEIHSFLDWPDVKDMMRVCRLFCPDG